MGHGSDKILNRLGLLYGEQKAPSIKEKLTTLVSQYQQENKSQKTCFWDQNDIFLITYGDSVRQAGQRPLKTLGHFLEQYAPGLFSFLHILPFYPYTSDDGFSVVDYSRVDDTLGTWEDVEQLGKSFRMVFDAVINHVSASSKYMREQCRGNPEYLDFLITADPQEDLSKVVRPRREPLLQEYPTHQGPRWFWATFSRDQLDLNFKNPDVLLEVINVLLFYASKGAQMLRLDAIAYLWKEPATSCIHLPQTHEVVKLIRDVMDEVYPNLLLLTETNVPHDENVSYFGEGGDEAQVIYNFSLPPLILHTVHTGNASKLTVWAQSIKSYGESTTYLNFTASHDGVGFRPTEGILTEDERQALLDITKKHGGKVSVKGNSDGTTTPYELNITYFDAVNDPGGGDSEDVQVAKFLLSQAIPLSFMGIPAVYIHSLLGSRNWYEGVDITGMPRSINRQKLDYDKLSAQAPNADNIRHRVLSEYSKMIKVRKSIPAFHPNADQEVLELGRDFFALKRTDKQSNQTIWALHNVTSKACEVENFPGLKGRGFKDLLHGEGFSKGENLAFSPFQVRWFEVI